MAGNQLLPIWSTMQESALVFGYATLPIPLELLHVLLRGHHVLHLGKCLLLQPVQSIPIDPMLLGPVEQDNFVNNGRSMLLRALYDLGRVGR